MRASDFEIHNYAKLDRILSNLCEMVVKGQQSEKDYGMVAAAVLDPDNQIVARLNRPGDDGKRVHAEHAAMEDYEAKYGPIPEGSIVITTLSPCNEHMDERDGPSCTSIINDSTVRKVYCGYMDPTQDDDTRQFNLMETADKSIRIKCKQFADTFLGDVHETQALEERRKKKRQVRHAAYGPGLFGGYGYYSGYGGDSSGDGGGGESMKNENFADGKNPGRKEIDPDVYEDLSNSIIARVARQIVPTIRAKSTPEGYVYLSTEDGLSLVIGCNIAGGSIDINLGSQPMETASSGPHKGAVTKIISAVYQAAVKRYGTPTEQGTLSIDHDAGHGVWQHIAQRLGLQYDAHVVKENFADGKNPQDKGDSKRHGVPTKASVSTLRKVAKQGGRKGQLAHWMANMKSGKKK